MRLFFLSLLTIALLASCSKNEDESKVNSKSQTEMTSVVHQGEVLDKIDTGNYSYLKISENNKSYWIAVPTMDVKKGEKIFFSKFMEMKNFKSETLNRTFESVLFVDDAKKAPTGMDMKNMHPNIKSQKKGDLNIKPLPDGQTIAQIYMEKDVLKGKSVKVKGKVVKYNPDIMNRNWIHIQDGTGNENNYDLLVTSNDKTKIGDVIVAEGTLALDKDFGAGYAYKVLIENAKITKPAQL
ncbi:GW dipeptide domain-containing protein [bacterium BMS3Abin03]|nr:GW dipeptide domain-containing protein [bacterium BMS3Abin03]MCG6958800.1 GW dipeptide domain-containing protein [bacterium BMS3Abin03]